MLSIARKTALAGNVSRIVAKSIVAAKPLMVVPGQKMARRQYSSGSASAEKVINKNKKIKIILIKSQSLILWGNLKQSR
jgi:hypothetical protein